MLKHIVPALAGFLALGSSAATACNGASDLCLNEIQTFGTGSPTARRASQYLEFRGPPGATIAAGTYLVAVDGDRNQNPGVIDVVLDLSGKSLGSNGFLVLLPQGNSFVTDPAASVEASAAGGFSGILGWSGNGGAVAFERPSTSFFLISAATAPVVGTDIDSVGNNDGVPDGSEHAGWTILDSIALADNANDKTYAALNFRVGAGSVGTTVVLSVRAWYAGRYGDSFGALPASWVASGPLGGSNPNFLLSAANVYPSGMGGKPLNHIGGSNVWANAAPVNGLPASPSVAEDSASALGLSLADTDAGTSPMTVALSVDSGSLTLANAAGVSIDSGADGSGAVTISGPLAAINAAINGLSFAPPADFNGSANLSISSNDNGNTGTDGPKFDSDNLVIEVRPVNDAPAFAIGADQTINADAGVQNLPGFATAISPGPADESGQALTFEVTPDLPALFAQAPAIAADGTLSYAPNASSTGVATISVRLRDDGGTADGGVDLSATQTFTITIEAPLAPATVIGFADDDGDDLLPLNGVVHFDVDFSRAIDFASVATTDFGTTGSATASIDNVSSIDADTVHVTVTATSGGSFQLQLTGEVLDTFAMAVSVPASDDSTIEVDALAPSLSSVATAAPDPSNAASVDFAVEFSEAVSGVDVADFAIASDGTLSGASITGVAGGGSSYVVTVATGSGDGHLALGLAASPSASDTAGNAIAGSALSAQFTIDRTAPLPVAINKLDVDPPLLPFVRFEIVLDEAVSGVDFGDFELLLSGSIIDAMLINVSGAGSTYVVEAYTGVASGSIGLRLRNDDGVADAAGNPLGAGLDGPSYTIDPLIFSDVFKDGFEN